VNEKDLHSQCEEWMQLDQNQNEEQKLIDMEMVRCVIIIIIII
jgi:hypothetical protein